MAPRKNTGDDGGEVSEAAEVRQDMVNLRTEMMNQVSRLDQQMKGVLEAIQGLSKMIDQRLCPNPDEQAAALEAQKKALPEVESQNKRAADLEDQRRQEWEQQRRHQAGLATERQ